MSRQARLHLIVEGYTEKRFADQVLVPHLALKGVYVSTRLVLTSRKDHYWYRGGLLNYEKAKKDITMWIKQEGHLENVFFSTMFDLYALPKNFPGYDNSKLCTDPYAKVECLENKLMEDIGFLRFIPYIQLYEFETLILADPRQLGCEFFEKNNEIKNLIEITSEKNPEEINDNPQTAPSKRIIKEIPEYEDTKSSSGPNIAAKIGLETLRNRCLHFGEWLLKLEKLPANPY